MGETMILFMASWCKYCQPVKQLILEKGMHVDILDIDLNFEAAKKYNIKQIPALVKEDGTVMIESAAIMEYLSNHVK
ncbi:hypothetical protein AVV29_gp121 [Vibrio phage phi 3]|uniref:GST N-terminal domain-containing protein n=1 Tax=Vibrio phage phi 3 TaxID=1589298 RepID=A0A0B5H2Z2_9CAUD|nr:hypothetical protein AVV29_gp121 [Vibrio phage phi 3]AJF40857.1 hypothetical protein SBVP3_0090 [Vibrio phage phi 3]